jgi:CheY-like chemotaxis protein
MNTRPILYAEDEEADVFLLQRAFKQAEISNPLRVVANGQEAIDYLAGTMLAKGGEQFPTPHLLLLDVKMPLKSGLEVLQWMRSQMQLRMLPTVVFTSSAQERDIRAAYELGANAYLVKPSSVAEMVVMAKVIKEFWLIMNQPPPDWRASSLSDSVAPVVPNT